MGNTNLPFNDRLHKAIVEGVRRTAEAIFSLSQRTDLGYVPRVTGFLARSGYVKNIENGAEIGYLTPYAQDVEEGFPRRPIKDGKDFELVIRKHKRKAHYRELNGVQYFVKESDVKEHKVSYKNAKLISFLNKEGERVTRTITHEGPRKGQFFLARAVKERIIDLPKWIKFSIEQEFK